MKVTKCFNDLYRFNNGICCYTAEKVVDIIDKLKFMENEELDEEVAKDLEWAEDESENSGPLPKGTDE